jgi:hypothetical protein
VGIKIGQATRLETKQQEPNNMGSMGPVTSEDKTKREKEEDRWVNRLYDAEQWGEYFVPNLFLDDLRYCCVRSPESMVAWIAGEAITSLRQNTWSVWMGERADKPLGPFSGHYQRGTVATRGQLDEDDAQLSATMTAAIEALTIMEKEVKEARRERVHISRAVVVTNSDTLVDFIGGLVYTEPLKDYAPELDAVFQKLARKVKLLEDGGLAVLFQTVLEDDVGEARLLALKEVERCVSLAGIVSTSKV